MIRTESKKSRLERKLTGDAQSGEEKIRLDLRAIGADMTRIEAIRLELNTS